MNKFTGNYTDIFKLSKQGSAFKLRSLVEAGGPTPPPSTTAAPGGVTPVNDNKVRFYLPAASTAFTVYATANTGYWRITDGTNTSSVSSSMSTPYYWNIYSYSSFLTLSGMSSSVSKVIELYPTDSAGNYNSGAAINGFSLHANSSNVDAVDFSYCTNIIVASMFSSSAPKKTFIQSSSNQPSSITEVRAVGVVGSASLYTGGGGYHPAYYNAGGIQIQGQQLDAAALDQLYTDVAGTSNDSIMVGGNPGTSSDDPTLATTKGWTVYGS